MVGLMSFVLPWEASWASPRSSSQRWSNCVAGAITSDAPSWRGPEPALLDGGVVEVRVRVQHNQRILDGLWCPHLTCLSKNCSRFLSREPRRPQHVPRIRHVANRRATVCRDQLVLNRVEACQVLVHGHATMPPVALVIHLAVVVLLVRLP